MERRTETPLALVEVAAAPASWLISATTSFMKRGTVTGTPDRGQVGLALHDLDFGRGLEGVVRADLRAEAILERRDDAAAVRVVLGLAVATSVMSSGSRMRCPRICTSRSSRMFSNPT